MWKLVYDRDDVFGVPMPEYTSGFCSTREECITADKKAIEEFRQDGSVR